MASARELLDKFEATMAPVIPPTAADRPTVDWFLAGRPEAEALTEMILGGAA